MITDIIMVRYNLLNTENNAIRAILTHTVAPYHLTVHDNYIKKENLGKLWNKLIKGSQGDYICLLNSDTKVSKGWLSKLVEVFEDKSVGCVGPSTDNCHNAQKTKVNKKLVDFSADYPTWVLGGFCLVFPKNIWLQVGGFPEYFGFYGQEVLFIDKIVEHGYRQIWRTDVFVHHDGEASIKKAEIRGEMNEIEERKKSKVLLKKRRK